GVYVVNHGSTSHIGVSGVGTTVDASPLPAAAELVRVVRAARLLTTRPRGRACGRVEEGRVRFVAMPRHGVLRADRGNGRTPPPRGSTSNGHPRAQGATSGNGNPRPAAPRPCLRRSLRQ